MRLDSWRETVFSMTLCSLTHIALQAGSGDVILYRREPGGVCMRSRPWGCVLSKKNKVNLGCINRVPSGVDISIYDT